MSSDLDEFKKQQDTSSWRLTQWIQVGEAKWRKQAEKFWRVPADIKDKRYAICQSCEHYIKITTQCQQCHCAMGIKTWLGGFACPIGKWEKEQHPEK